MVDCNNISQLGYIVNLNWILRWLVQRSVRWLSIKHNTWIAAFSNETTIVVKNEDLAHLLTHKQAFRQDWQDQLFMRASPGHWTAIASANPAACRSETKIPLIGAAGLASELEIAFFILTVNIPRGLPRGGFNLYRFSIFVFRIYYWSCGSCRSCQT